MSAFGNETAEMPKDVNSNSMQILGMKNGAVETVVASGGAPTNSGILDADRDITIRVVPTEDIYFKIDTGGVAAAGTSAIMAGGSPEYFNLRAGQRFNVLQVTIAGSVRISQMD